MGTQMKVKTDGMVERVARALAKAHDKLDNSRPRSGGALLAYNAGSFAVPYWDALARAALEACHHAELLEALRRISDYRSEAEDLTPEETIWRTIDEMQEIALTVLAKIGGDQ